MKQGVRGHASPGKWNFLNVSFVILVGCWHYSKCCHCKIWRFFLGDLPLNSLTVPLTVPNAKSFSLFFFDNCFAEKIVSPSISSHALKKREHDFPFGISKRAGLTVQTFRCSRKFSTETTWKVVFHLLSNRILRKLFVNGHGKQTLSYYNFWLWLEAELHCKNNST